VNDRIKEIIKRDGNPETVKRLEKIGYAKVLATNSFLNYTYKDIEILNNTSIFFGGLNSEKKIYMNEETYVIKEIEKDYIKKEINLPYGVQDTTNYINKNYNIKEGAYGRVKSIVSR